MKTGWYLAYNLVLALWVGGMAIFTFIVTPAIFKSFPRDMAGEIVGKLFPGYFLYNLVVAALALVLVFLMFVDRSRFSVRLSMLLIVAAIVVALFVQYKVYPDTVRVKQEVTSFEGESSDSPARKKFSQLHALSATLNMLLLADGTVLLMISSLMRR